jgi:hemolysin III
MDFHDPLASFSHLLMAGVMVFLCAALFRVAVRPTFTEKLSLIFYSFTCIGLYTASGLYHGVAHDDPDTKRVWQLLDQSAIFGLIYGSNVPFFVYLLRRGRRKRQLWMMGCVWAAGVASLWLLPKPPYTALVFTYLGMGILGFWPLPEYIPQIGWRGLRWVARMAVFYVAGGLCEAFRWPEPFPGTLGHHEMLHFFNMLGTLAHYGLLFRVVTRKTKPPPPIAPH